MCFYLLFDLGGRLLKSTTIEYSFKKDCYSPFLDAACLEDGCIDIIGVIVVVVYCK